MEKENVLSGSAYSDADLQDRVEHWLDYYTKYGDRHYADTKDWKIFEIYFGVILEKVLEELELEEKEVEQMATGFQLYFNIKKIEKLNKNKYGNNGIKRNKYEKNTNTNRKNNKEQ